MISWMLPCLLISFVFASQDVQKLSSNTHSFISNRLGMRTDALYLIRSGKICSLASQPAAHLVQPKFDTRLLQELRNNLIEAVVEMNNYNFEEFLFDLNERFPSIDHINELYDDYASGVIKGLLHFAVSTRNFNLVRFLKDNGINPNLLDSNNFTALELAYNEALPDMMSLIIRNFKRSLLAPFLDYKTIAHYAAAHDRVDILVMINVNDAFSFDEADDGWSPLELALSHGQIDAADCLIEMGAYFRPEVIKIIHFNNLEHFESNLKVALYMCSQYQGLVYLTDSEGMDLMLLAIKHDRFDVVVSIFNNGYNEAEADYNLIEKAVELNASKSLINLIQNSNKY